MDVELPEKDGIEASREILDIIPDVFLVYATGHLEYMPEAFEVYAFDYLVKPYKLDRLIATTIKIQELLAQRENRIPRIEPIDNYLIFYTVNKSTNTMNIARVLHGRRDWESIL